MINNNSAQIGQKIDHEVSELMDKIKEMEKGHSLDLSSDEDLSIAVMNLISIEEHLFFTAQKTEDRAYFELLFEVREQRKALMKMLLTNTEGEVWCTSKHLLAASMRCMEVGTKFLSKGDQTKAEEFFQRSYDLYNLFWGLNLKLIQKQEAGTLMKEQRAELAEMEKEMKLEEEGEAAESDEVAETGEIAVVIEEKTTVTKACPLSGNDEAKAEVIQSKSVRGGLLGKLGKAVSSALDCCRE